MRGRRRGWGKIERMRSGRYRATYVGPDLDRHLAPATFDNKAAAEAWLGREHDLVASDQWTAPRLRTGGRQDAETLAEYAEEWLAHRRTSAGHPLKDRTREHYRALLDSRILPFLGDEALGDIAPEVVSVWYERQERAATPTSTAHAYGLLHAIMASAAKKDMRGVSKIQWNPCQIEGAQKALTQHQARPASVAELQTIIDNMMERYQLPIALMGWCALRFGETVALERADVDVVRRSIQIKKGVVRVEGERRLDTPKNRRMRVVHYPPHLDDMVKRHLDLYAEPGRAGKLFPSRTGGYLSQSTLNGKPKRIRLIKGRIVNESATAFRKACDVAGRPDLRLHDLRHTGAVLAAATGATLAELQARLGHSTVTAAMRYQHAATDRDAAISEALSKMVRR
jgi:integrase